jgi:hypothetical protein
MEPVSIRLTSCAARTTRAARSRAKIDPLKRGLKERGHYSLP